MPLVPARRPGPATIVCGTGHGRSRGRSRRRRIQLAELSSLRKLPATRRRESKNPDAPIRWVGMAFDQSAGLQPVQDARKGDRLHVKEFGQSNLVDPFVLIEILYSLPLRSGQTGVAGNLFKSLPEQSRGLVQQKAKRW